MFIISCPFSDSYDSFCSFLMQMLLIECSIGINVGNIIIGSSQRNLEKQMYKK